MPDNRDNPMGLTPVMKLDGSKIPTMRWKINSATSNIFIGDVVKKDAGGGVELSGTADGILVVGVVEALQDSNGVNIGTHGSSISNKYILATESGYAIVALALQDCVFRIQSDGATAEADIWNTSDIVVTGGSTTTGRSQTEFDYSDQSSLGANDLVIIGKVDEPGNTWGLANVDLLVIFMRSTWIGNGDPVGT